MIDEESLKLNGHTHIQESLSQVAGVNLQRGSGQEYLPAIRSPVLSGTGACGGFVMAEDGIPLRAAGFCNINELFEANSEVAQRIEVIRGPGTVLYGSNAIHGVVNVVTPEIHKGGTAAFEGGQYDYSRARFYSGTVGSKHSASVAVSATHDAGYRDKSGFDQQKISVRHKFVDGDLKVTTGFTATNLNQETAGYIEGLDAYKDEDLARSNLNPEAYRDAVSARLWSSVERPLGDGKVKVTPYLRYTDMAFLQHFLPGTPLEENGQKSIGIQSAWYRDVSDELSLIAGLDAEFTTSYLIENQESPTQGSAFLQATIPVGKHYDYDVDATMLAPFFNMDWRPAVGWSLSAGARFESMRYDYTNNLISGNTKLDGTPCIPGPCRFNRPPGGDDNFDNWSSVIAAAYNFAELQKIYVRLARAFRAPQATELYRLQRVQNIADLDSEQINSFEGGVEGRYDRLKYSLAYYDMDKDNVIYRDVDFLNRSDGKTEHRGVELEIQYQINRDLGFALNATRARHRYRNDELLSGINIKGNDVDAAPRHFGSARIRYSGIPDAAVELEFVEMGSYYLDPENLHTYDGHSLVNVRASYQVNPKLKLYARLINATDRAYAERADFTTFSQERYFPGAPRTFFLSAEYSW